MRLTATDWTTLNAALHVDGVRTDARCIDLRLAIGEANAVVIDFGNGDLKTFEVDSLVLDAEILPISRAITTYHWHAVADSLAEALRNELLVSKKQPLPSAREALARYDPRTAQIDGDA
jgi:hypothetical protein